MKPAKFQSAFFSSQLRLGSWVVGVLCSTGKDDLRTTLSLICRKKIGHASMTRSQICGEFVECP